MLSMDILFNRFPLVVNVELANVLGLSESIVLQQVHYWLQKNKEEGRNLKDGFTWTYNTYIDWQEQFPFWSDSTIKRTISKLENMGLLVSASYNKEKFDRTKWYRIDYDALNNLVTARCGQNDPIDNIGVSEDESAITQEEALPNDHSQTNDARQALNIRLGQNDPIEDSKLTKSTMSNCPDPSGQFDPMDDVKLTRPIPETNNRDYPETTTTGSCCCEEKLEQIKRLFHDSGIDISSEHAIKQLAAAYSGKEIKIIAATLADRKKRGYITNPGGVLSARPAAVASAILKGEFYPIEPGSKNNKAVTTYSDYETYIPPEQGG